MLEAAEEALAGGCCVDLAGAVPVPLPAGFGCCESWANCAILSFTEAPERSGGGPEALAGGPLGPLAFCQLAMLTFVVRNARVSCRCQLLFAFLLRQLPAPTQVR